MRFRERIIALSAIAMIAISGVIAAPASAAPIRNDELTEIQLAEMAQKIEAKTPPLSSKESKELDGLIKSEDLELWIGGKKVEDVTPKIVMLPVATAAGYQPQTWGACGIAHASSKHVRTWTVQTVPYRASPAILRCGTWNSKNPNGGWGFRHISGKHGGEWGTMGLLVNANWRDIADFAISDALSNVYKSSSNAANNTFSYNGIIQLKRYNGKTIKTYYVKVAVDQTDRRIITAYYTSKKM